MEEYSNMWKHCNLLLSTQLVLKTSNLKIEKNILNLKTEKKKIEAQNYGTICFPCSRTMKTENGLLEHSLIHSLWDGFREWSWE